MKEYTVLSGLSVIMVVVVDVVLKTFLIKRKMFWMFVAAMFAFMVVGNGYLTWRPIVLYNADMILNVRLLTIPVEDFLYGFSLITLTVVLWEYAKGEKKQ